MSNAQKGMAWIWLVLLVAVAAIGGWMLFGGLSGEKGAPATEKEAAVIPSATEEAADLGAVAPVAAPAPRKTAIGGSCDKILTASEISQACGNTFAFTEKSSVEGISLACGRTFKSGDNMFEFAFTKASAATAFRKDVYETDLNSKRQLTETVKKFDSSAKPVFETLSGLGEGAYKYTDGYGVLSVNFYLSEREGYVLADEAVCGFSGLESLARKLVGRL